MIRSKVQFHLPSCIVMMLLGSLALFINAIEKKNSGKLGVVSTNISNLPYNSGDENRWPVVEVVFRIEREEVCEWGWPVKMLDRVTLKRGNVTRIGYATPDQTDDEVISNSLTSAFVPSSDDLNESSAPYSRWHITGVFLNAIVAFIIICIGASICEYILRRCSWRRIRC